MDSALAALAQLSSSVRWEELASYLYLTLNFLKTAPSPYPHVLADLTIQSTSFLLHSEPRVRSLAAECIGECVRMSSNPKSTFDSCFEIIWASVTTTYKISRAPIAPLKTSSYDPKPSPVPDPNDPTDLTPQPPAIALDDTSGWRELETSFTALISISTALGPTPFWSHSTLSVIQYCATQHVNRHVRAESINLCIRICEIWGTDLTDEFADNVKTVLEGTLRDNWSQVRMVACKLCRSYLDCTSGLQQADEPFLAPYMSLNRFYLADGVRIFSQETWKIHVTDGKAVLERNFKKVIMWYLKCLDEDNHVVRESAALAVGEAVTKLDEEVVETMLEFIVENVKVAFYDESWPVRDRALVCLAHVAGRFGVDDANGEVWDLLWGNLRDQIWSVRDNAGWGIVEWLKGDLKRGVGEEKLKDMVNRFNERVQEAKKEPKRSRKDVEKEVMDKAMHTNNQLYSCGSLAPKLHKSANRVAGCSDCMVTRPTRLWEVTDGCVFLLSHLAVASIMDDKEIMKMFEQAVDATRHEIYVEHETLKTTVMKAFGKIIEEKDTNIFKRIYCNYIVDYVVRWIGGGGSGDGLGNLMVFEGERCLEKIAKRIGGGIARGRVEEVCGESGLEVFDRAVMGGGGGMMGGGMGMGMRPETGMGAMGAIPPRPPANPSNPPTIKFIPSVQGLSVSGATEL